MKTNYPGIDYATGTGTNQDAKTGIRYGVIPSRDISPEAFNDIATHGTHRAGLISDKLANSVTL